MGSKLLKIAGALLRRLIVVMGALTFTVIMFLVLPLTQSISQPPDADTIVQSVATSEIEPPPPPPEEEPPKQEKPEEKPPDLAEVQEPLDLSQLELALNPGAGGDGWMSGDFAVSLKPVVSAASNSDSLFSLADLDQKPRIIHQPGPTLSGQMRRKLPGTVYIIFIVDERGRVENPIVQSTSDPIFEAPALAALKQWRFEPGKRSGQSVRFRMRVPITFPKE